MKSYLETDIAQLYKRLPGIDLPHKGRRFSHKKGLYVLNMGVRIDIA
jgi:hypothetical protein